MTTRVAVTQDAVIVLDLPWLYARAAQRVPADAVDDVVQETALAAWQQAETRERAGVRTWLNGILRHKVADFYRRDPGWGWETLDGDVVGAEHSEGRMLLRMLLWRIPVDYRRVLWLRFYGGLSLKEVGSAMGISAEAARARCRRAIGALREEYFA